jgi:hypothetical protein
MRIIMGQTIQENNKALVLDAFDIKREQSKSGLPMFGDAFPN